MTDRPQPGDPWGYVPGGPMPHGYQYGPYGPGLPGSPHYVTSDDTTGALLVYIGSLVLGFPVALIVYFVKKNRSAFIRFHAAQALNYMITVAAQVFGTLLVLGMVALVLGSWLPLIPLIPFMVFEAIAQYVFIILAAVRADRGEYYRMPTWTCFPMVR